MRICMLKTWRCIAWVGPKGETGHGLWLPQDQVAQNASWCAWMDSTYPGWKHCILERKGEPKEKSPEGWVQHPFYGDMQYGPMDL
ncbi:MAG TPA: hypothetical protein VFB38_04715 [Chthonomonadaceae bacterium]|nr:hypothetical protein [Chthonomonadaceae bacterium]